MKRVALVDEEVGTSSSGGLLSGWPYYQGILKTSGVYLDEFTRLELLTVGAVPGIRISRHN